MPDDVVSSTLWDILAGLAIIPLTLGGRSLLHWVRSTRPGRKLWALNERLKTTIVITSGPVHDPVELTEIVYPAEARAAAEIEFYLHQIYGDSMVVCLSTSASVPGDQLKGNLVLIGGPVHNVVSRRLLERLDLPLRFEGYELIADDRRWQATISPESVITSDVGLVVLGRNPFYRRGRLIYIAGCRTYGCLAAARALLDQEVTTTLKAIGGRTSCAFAVEADVHGNEVLSLDVVPASVRPL